MMVVQSISKLGQQQPKVITKQKELIIRRAFHQQQNLSQQGCFLPMQQQSLDHSIKLTSTMLSYIWFFWMRKCMTPPEEYDKAKEDNFCKTNFVSNIMSINILFKMNILTMRTRFRDHLCFLFWDNQIKQILTYQRLN